jgi:hypothetical protein
MKLPRFIALSVAFASAAALPCTAATIAQFYVSAGMIATDGTDVPPLYAMNEDDWSAPSITMVARFNADAPPIESTAYEAVYGAFEAYAIVSPIVGDSVMVPLTNSILGVYQAEGDAMTSGYYFHALSPEGYWFWMDGFAEDYPAFVPSLAFPLTFPAYPNDATYVRYDIGVAGPTWSTFTDYIVEIPTMTIIRRDPPTSVPDETSWAGALGVGLLLLVAARRRAARG